MKTNELIEKWRINKGNGIIACKKEDTIIDIVQNILEKMYANPNNTGSILIVVPNYEYRTKLVDIISKNVTIKEKLESKELIIYTAYYISSKHLFNYVYRLTVVISLGCFEEDITRLVKNGKFKLFIDDGYRLDNEKKLNVLRMANYINEEDSKSDNGITPVEETLIPIPICSDETNLGIKKLNDYIQVSLNIFGNFDNINSAIKGDLALNISALDYCNRIALDNGWNEHLDMNIEMNRRIDALYNPIALKERAKTTYEFIRRRLNILANLEEKLEVVLNILESHEFKHILIINKNTEFADKVTDYINEHSFGYKCRSYHNNLRKKICKDENGEVIRYKSGASKGEPKLFGYQSQMNEIERDFEKGDINVISTNSAVNKDISVSVDCVIITSPQCLTIEEYKYRLTKCKFNSPIILYTLFTKDTLEERLITKRNNDKYHHITNSEIISVNDVKNSDIVIVD